MNVDDVKNHYLNILSDVDKIPKDTIYQRRAAFNIIWDFYQKLLLDVGVHLCGLYEEALKISHVKTRWNKIKTSLSFSDDPNIWNDLINRINNLRQAIQHSKKNQEFAPSSNEIESIKNKSEEFLNWFISAGMDFYKKSNNYTIVEYIKNTIFSYCSDADIILGKFGTEEIPYVVKYAYEPIKTDSGFNEIPKLKKYIEKRRFEITSFKDVTYNDINSLISLIEIINKINAWEDSLLKENICPKCGGKISQEQHYSGGGYDEPPSQVHVRVGCNECDYELMSESYSI